MIQYYIKPRKTIILNSEHYNIIIMLHRDCSNLNKV